MYPVHVMVSHLLSHLMKIFQLKLDRIEKSGDQEERFWIFKGSVVIISLKNGLKYGVFLGIRPDQRRSKQCGNKNRVFSIICMRYHINNLKKIHSPLYFDCQNQLYCSLFLQVFGRDHLKR